MAEFQIPEDEAALYVVGGLGAAERREFEARLEKSAELRTLVRELQTGAVALTMAMPQREPPPHLWTRIKEAVAEETNRKIVSPAFWVACLRSGWAAAAACLIGWLLYAVWVSHLSPRVTSPIVATEERAPFVEPKSENYIAPETVHLLPQPAVTNNLPPRPPGSLAMTGQMAILRREISELQSHVAHLSHALTQQQAFLSNSSQITFFQLTPPNAEGAASPTAAAAAASSEVQRALLMALARELGLVRAFGGMNAESGNPMKSGGVDFVTLPPATGDRSGDDTAQPATKEVATPTDSQSPLQASLDASADTNTAPASPATAASSTAIPGFVSGTNVVLAVDPSVVSSTGGSLTVWSGTGIGDHLALGTFSLGYNPVVATIPMGSPFSAGSIFTITAGTAANWITPSNTIGQFPPPTLSPP